MTREEILQRYPRASEAFLRANADAHRVAPGPVAQRCRDDEPVAEDAGETAYKGRCLVRITSFRRKLCDERNLYDKHFVDALKEAGAFIDDSPAYVQVEVSQERVMSPHEERTVIQLSPCQ
jgi:hypothetical protein